MPHRRFGIIGPRKPLSESKVFENKALSVVTSAVVGGAIGAAIGAAVGSSVTTSAVAGALSSTKSSLSAPTPSVMVGYDSGIHKEVKRIMEPEIKVDEYKPEFKLRKMDYKIDLPYIRSLPLPRYEDLPTGHEKWIANANTNTKYKLFGSRFGPSIKSCAAENLENSYMNYTSKDIQAQVWTFWNNHGDEICSTFIPANKVTYAQTGKLLEIMNPEIAQKYVAWRSHNPNPESF